MKIERLDIYHIKIPLIAPWKTAYGTEDGIESVLIKAYSNTYQAWVETCPLGKPLYSSETAKSVFNNIVDHFGPMVINADLRDCDSIPSLLNAFQGNSFAKAGLEQCWWALAGLERDTPFRQLMAGHDVAVRSSVRVRTAFGINESTEALIGKIAAAVESGIRDIKLKIKPGHDLDVLRQVRNKFPDTNIMVDCNGGYSLDDSDFFRCIDDLKLEMIEQPLPYNNLYDHALLQAEINTPICLDESISSIEHAVQAIKLKACKIINIKIGRVGGISQAIKIHALCKENGLGSLVGGMMESGIGTRFNIELAAAFNGDYANGITIPSDYHKIELTQPTFPGSVQGMVDLRKDTSFTVDEDVLDEFTVSSKTID